MWQVELGWPGNSWVPWQPGGQGAGAGGYPSRIENDMVVAAGWITVALGALLVPQATQMIRSG